ncbi:MAG: hypothetical protein RJA87_2685 [Pseudomonadota bacterium]|jgi:hypothetical protein
MAAGVGGETLNKAHLFTSGHFSPSGKIGARKFSPSGGSSGAAEVRGSFFKKTSKAVTWAISVRERAYQF